MVLTSPLPEEFLDLGHIAAARDVFDRFVVDRHDGGTDERLAGEVGQLDLYLGLFARLVGLLAGLDVDVQHSFFRRNDDFLRLGVDAAVGHGQGLDEEVGHVLFHDADLAHDALAVEPDHFGRQINAVGRPGEQQNRAACAVGVDLHLHLVARGVFSLVGDQLQMVETELSTVEPAADDGEHVAALDRVFLCLFGVFLWCGRPGCTCRRDACTTIVGKFIRNPILPCLRGRHLLLGRAFDVRIYLPRLHRRFDRLPVLVADLKQAKMALALDRFAVECAGRKMCGDLIAYAIVAAIDPRIDRERFAGNQYCARADDGAA